MMQTETHNFQKFIPAKYDPIVDRLFFKLNFAMISAYNKAIR